MTKPKAQGANKGATGTGTAPAPEATEDKPKQTRLTFGKDRKLAMLIASLVAILSNDVHAKLLTEDEQAKVAVAKKAADEIGSDLLQPTIDRIAAIRVELTGLLASDKMDVASVKELSVELDRLTKRKATIEEMLSK